MDSPVDSLKSKTSGRKCNWRNPQEHPRPQKRASEQKRGTPLFGSSGRLLFSLFGPLQTDVVCAPGWPTFPLHPTSMTAQLATGEPPPQQEHLRTAPNPGTATSDCHNPQVHFAGPKTTKLAPRRDTGVGHLVELGPPLTETDFKKPVVLARGNGLLHVLSIGLAGFQGSFRFCIGSLPFCGLGPRIGPATPSGV